MSADDLVNEFPANRLPRGGIRFSDDSLNFDPGSSEEKTGSRGFGVDDLSLVVLPVIALCVTAYLVCTYGLKLCRVRRPRLFRSLLSRRRLTGRTLFHFP